MKILSKHSEVPVLVESKIGLVISAAARSYRLFTENPEKGLLARTTQDGVERLSQNRFWICSKAKYFQHRSLNELQITTKKHLVHGQLPHQTTPKRRIVSVENWN